VAAPRQVQLADREHLLRRHQHLVAAEINALRILPPPREAEAERPGEGLLSELPRAAARDAREDRREQVRAARAVLHLGARLADDRLREDGAHPVAAAHPRAVILAARRLQTRPHRQEILDRDRLLARIRILPQLGKVGGDRDLDALDQAFLDRDADERRDDALRNRLDVGEPGRSDAARVMLRDELAAPADQHRAKLRQRGSSREVYRRPLLRCLAA
jgi:hypothetical protein